MVHLGLFGLRYGPDGLRFAPCVPARLAGAALRGYPYRAAVLDLTVTGSGTRVVSNTLDGERLGPDASLPGTLVGRHDVLLEVV